jgi:hypothetical protein
VFNTRKAKGRKDKSGKAHTAFAQDTNRKAQKGAGAGGVARPLATSYHDCNTAESGVEEVHVAFVLVYGQIPIFTQEESFLKPFRSNVVQSAKLATSEAGAILFGLLPTLVLVLRSFCTSRLFQKA